MWVREAKAAARRWVIDEASKTPGFRGAYVGGSVPEMAEDAEVPATSDLDVYVVLDDPGEALKPGKFIYDGALLEGSYIAREAVSSPEAVLGSAPLAGGFRSPNIILDPSGELTALQEVVSREFAKRRWVRTRCENAA